MGGLGRAFVKETVFVAALFGFSTAAFAQADPGINPVVVATPNTVTLSRAGLVTYAGYVLTFKNTTTNGLNRIYFNADAFNTNSDEVVKFDSSNLPACTGYDTASLRCQTTISLVPGEQREFFVVVRAPPSGTEIRIEWTAGGSEGKGKGVGCCGMSGTATTTLIDPSTSIEATLRTQSFVKNNGGTLFTGAGSVTKPSDQGTTRVVIDPFTSAEFAVGTILETFANPLDNVDDLLDLDCANGARFVKCFRSDIDVPNVDYSVGPPGFLTFVLRIDSSVIKPKTMIEAVRIRHDGAEVYMCTTPVVYPCITERKHYKNKSVPGWTKELDADFEWTFKSDGNGVFEFF